VIIKNKKILASIYKTIMSRLIRKKDSVPKLTEEEMERRRGKESQGAAYETQSARTVMTGKDS